MILSTKRCVIAAAALLAVGVGPQPATYAAAAAKHSAEKHSGDRAPKTRPKSQERVFFTAAETATARPEGLPGHLRMSGDDVAAFQRLIEAAPAAREPWLVLSGGGENGAFAAGILSGWSQAGNRPSFGVVTGVSTGALIAPFAFLGPEVDGDLKENYTQISAADVFEFGGTAAALTDTWPLKERIDKLVTRELLQVIAGEHVKGRRLLIATTQVDTERPVLWDMGAIASLSVGPDGDRYADKALKLFREIVLASTAVPGVFPPVMVEAVAQDGKVIQEMHDDGGALAPFFLAPEAAIQSPTGAGVHLPAKTIYLIMNNRLNPEFGLAPRSVLGVLGRTMSAAIKAQMRGAIVSARIFAKRTNLDLRVAVIGDRFTKVSPAPFDQAYMKALFDHGESLGRDGTAFSAEPDAAPTAGRSGAVKGAKATSPEPNLAER